MTHSRSGEHEAFGNYRLLERIGAGGMGEVYRAEQTAPMSRTVAIKIIRRGLDTDRVITRFEAERQALALMDHPNIARIFDAGSTPRGCPYFIMEYVRGIPITAYCDQYRTPTRGRLELILQLCDGVQLAHQKAIIHRDLKPTNVLVTTQDDKPVPKIIDFGRGDGAQAHREHAVHGAGRDRRNTERVDIRPRVDAFGGHRSLLGAHCSRVAQERELRREDLLLGPSCNPRVGRLMPAPFGGGHMPIVTPARVALGCSHAKRGQRAARRLRGGRSAELMSGSD
jgi:serine/threonine protein kinase